MLDIYPLKTVTWKRVKSLNEFGEPVFETTEIQVAFQGGYKKITNKYGQEVVSRGRFICNAEVNVGDVLEYDGSEWLVMDVYDREDFGGNKIRVVAC